MRTEQEERKELEGAVWAALEGVHDPEIPAVRIVDLGLVERVAVSSEAVEVDLLPTFLGCPALDVIRAEAEAAVRAVAGDREVRVRFVHAPPWTSDRITERGKEAMRSYGLAPPEGPGRAFVPLAALGRGTPPAACPFCGSRDTVLESAFGPTLCRSVHFCRACRNPFEAFRPKPAA
ncbi:MAG TPA: 1,2-phenylacetyl-CoA epoxidase subunit PaaD [Actinomycetota bacterium]|nr:1,2-phenylacetyl-CoA epoxidase subunit PaaD [Actinomycetota bacterium]